jgi:hypothetical protein
MTYLANMPGTKNTLLAALIRTARQTTGARGVRVFYGITCYFDSKSLEIVAKRINEVMKELDAHLIGFHIAIDVGEWIKNRNSIEVLEKKISRATGLNASSVSVTPIYFDGCLFHPKGYCLISPKKSSRIRKGFAILTSGNFTERGFGISERSNVEIYDIIYEISKLEKFVDTFNNLIENHKPPDDKLIKHDKFLLALKIFREGQFYHEWHGSLSSESRYTLTLTEKGVKLQKQDKKRFGRYEGVSKSITIDPLNLGKNIFDQLPKPFPNTFWRLYSIDTLMGRWVPWQISNIIDEVLEKDIQPYLERIKILTEPNILNKEVKTLTKELVEFRKNELIKENKDVINNWKERVGGLHTRSDLVKYRILRYEPIPEMHDSTRELFIKTINHLERQLNLGKQLKGLKAVLHRAITNGIDNFDIELNNLQIKAEAHIEKNFNI